MTEPYTPSIIKRAEDVYCTRAVSVDVRSIALVLTVLGEMRDPIEHPIGHAVFPKLRASVATSVTYGKVRAISHIDAAITHARGKAEDDLNGPPCP